MTPMRAQTDVLVIGSGAAGMYAAIEAAHAGCEVLLADRSLIGRGGATVMAQMTVAVALGAETPDDWSHHYDDTLKAGRELCDASLARLLCEQGPECIRGGGVMSARATLTVWRGSEPAKGRWESYEVPFDPGQSVLDGLRWIRVNRDPTLAVRYSCMNANACKECMVEIDGKTVYACTERLRAGEMRIAPLSNKLLARDLVTEIAPPAERFGRR